MTCRACGHRSNDERRYCTQCGEPLTPSTAPVGPVSTLAGSAPSPAGQPDESSSRRRLLAFGIGGLLATAVVIGLYIGAQSVGHDIAPAPPPTSTPRPTPRSVTDPVETSTPGPVSIGLTEDGADETAANLHDVFGAEGSAVFIYRGRYVALDLETAELRYGPIAPSNNFGPWSSSALVTPFGVLQFDGRYLELVEWSSDPDRVGEPRRLIDIGEREGERLGQTAGDTEVWLSYAIDRDGHELVTFGNELTVWAVAPADWDTVSPIVSDPTFGDWPVFAPRSGVPIREVPGPDEVFTRDRGWVTSGVDGLILHDGASWVRRTCAGADLDSCELEIRSTSDETVSLTDDFYDPEFSSDRRHLAILTYGSEAVSAAPAIRIVDTETGEIEDLDLSTTAFSLRWITNTHLLADGELLVDITDGSQTRFWSSSQIVAYLDSIEPWESFDGVLLPGRAAN